MEAKAPAAEQANTGRTEDSGGAKEKQQETTKPLSAFDRQYAPQPDVPRRIHIIGTGSIGKLVAHSLRGVDNPPPVTLVFHRYGLLHAWQHSKKKITLQSDEYTVEQGGFDVELAPKVNRVHGVQLDGNSPDVYDVRDETGAKPHEIAQLIAQQQEAVKTEKAQYRPLEGRQLQSNVSEEPIHNLIITTKTIRTINALSAIKHRITKDSTICFLQNGMGVIDDVNKEVFTDEATRPTYVQGIVSHGANVPPEKAEQDPFFVVHAGHGTIALGVVPKQSLAGPPDPPASTGPDTDNDGRLEDEKVDDLAPTARYLIRTLSRTAVLCAVPFTPIELLQLQLEKLVVNTIINPLTSILDHRTGAILYNMALTRTMRLMLAETSLIICSLPELRGIPNIPNRFGVERLEAVVINGARKTKNNISSMLADVRAGRQTEIEYINGYIVKRGEEMGIKAVVNYAIMQVVIGKAMMVEREYQDSLPLEGEGEGINRE